MLVTNREYDNVLVFSERLFTGNFKKLKRMVPQNAKAPPEPKQEEDDKKQTS